MLRSIGVLSLLALASPAFADGLSYNYVELGYLEIDVDDLDVDGDGFNIAGSFEIGDSTFIFADYAQADLDFGIDLDQISLGVGLFGPIGDNVDLFGTIQYVSVEASALGLSVDDDGFGASVGIRALVSDALELAASINYEDLDDSGDDTSFGAEAWWNLGQNFALGLQAEFGDDVTAYGIGGRLYFGQ